MARAAELATAIRMMPDNEDRAELFFKFMLSEELLEESINGLTDGLLDELTCDVGLIVKGI